MNQKKISARAYSIIKSSVTAAVLPVFLIYILIDKPDYKIMNGLAKVILPAAQWIGDGITWPVHAIGSTVSGIRELSNLRTENEELKVRLSAALAQKNECDIAISENQKLTRQMDIVRQAPTRTIIADITYDNQSFGRSTFFINKGSDSGIKTGMAVVSFEMVLVGIVSDVGDGFAKVRSLIDTKSNIPVRIAGSEVYGFLQGNGSDTPTMGFFSDPEFQPTKDLKLMTSGIRGILPDGINIGKMTNNEDVDVVLPSQISTVMVLQFDAKDKYK